MELDRYATLVGGFATPTLYRNDLKSKQKRRFTNNELFAGIPCDPSPENVADVYAQIKIAAQEQGTSLSECDLWIAATALTLDAILVTSDSDYQRIADLGLRLEDWKN